MTRIGHWIIASLAVCLAALNGCSARQSESAAVAEHASRDSHSAIQTQPQAMSLLGQPLYPPPLTAEVKKRREAELLEAQADYDRDPHDEVAAVWLGRRLSYLGEYREAIDVYTNALALHAESTRLLRHRGHRYITLRLFNLALDDLELAARLMESEPDDWEPDGQPNARNQPTGTNQSNILYHLGLAHYLTGEYGQAARAWRQCSEISRTDDMRVAAVYWLYLTLRKAKRDRDAEIVLTSVSANMEIFENHTYHRLLLLFKGEIEVADVRSVGSEPATLGDVTIDEATAGYGIGMWHTLRGEQAQADAQWRSVINNTNWAAFGHIAAEAELAR